MPNAFLPPPPPPPNAAATTGPRLPTRRRAPPASAPRATGGRLAGVLIGAARVRKAFGGGLFAGTVTSYQSPFFRVRYTDGDEEDLTGTELAPVLDYTEADYETRAVGTTTTTCSTLSASPAS